MQGEAAFSSYTLRWEGNAASPAIVGSKATARVSTKDEPVQRLLRLAFELSWTLFCIGVQKVSGREGYGLGTILHVLPFQNSIRVCPARLLLWNPPTDQTSLAERTATPSRKLLTDPGWLGLLTTLYVLPFHCSISVCPPWAKD